MIENIIFTVIIGSVLFLVRDEEEKVLPLLVILGEKCLATLLSSGFEDFPFVLSAMLGFLYMTAFVAIDGIRPKYAHLVVISKIYLVMCSYSFLMSLYPLLSSAFGLQSAPIYMQTISSAVTILAHFTIMVVCVIGGVSLGRVQQFFTHVCGLPGAKLGHRSSDKHNIHGGRK